MNPQMQRYGGYQQHGGRRPGQQSQSHHAQQQAQIALQQQQAQQKHIAEHQAAARRSRKPTSLDLPEDVEDLVIGDGVQHYKRLRELEKKLDYTMQRKRLDFNESINRFSPRQRTMRVWISTTTQNQPWQTAGDDDGTFTFSEGSNGGSWKVQIQGQLLPNEEIDDASEDSDDEDQPMTDGDKPNEPEPIQRPFSHYFKSISLEYEKSSRYASDPTLQVEWKKQPGNEFNNLAFERRGDENLNVTVNLIRDEQPERFRLSHALSRTLDMEEGHKAEVVTAIWDYVKFMGLQEDEEKRSVRCDDNLRQIFDRPVVYFPDIPGLIATHLHPMPPIKLPYTIRVDSEFYSDPKPTIYDIRVCVEDPLRTRILSFTQNPEHMKQLQQINNLNDQIALCVQALARGKARHTFFSAMSKDPVGFVKMYLKSQKRDLETIMGEVGRGGGEDGSGPEFAKGGKGGVWDSELVQEAVRYKLASSELKRPR